jgi:hypothetical protein
MNNEDKFILAKNKNLDVVVACVVSTLCDAKWKDDFK